MVCCYSKSKIREDTSAQKDGIFLICVEETRTSLGTKAGLVFHQDQSIKYSGPEGL